MFDNFSQKGVSTKTLACGWFEHKNTKNTNIKRVSVAKFLGAKFRETPSCSKYKLNHLYQDAIDKLTIKLARHSKSKSGIFYHRKNIILQEIKLILKQLPSKFPSSQILNRPEVIKYIQYLHDRFVIVPVDKASNNFGIVCKKFYLEVIQKELGISYDGNIIGNKEYIPVCQEASDIYKCHKDTLLHVFGIKLLDENQKIPLLYWTSKQHKDPYKFRFIAGASHCYNKQIAVDLSLALKCIKIHFRNYCKVIQKRTGISFFWSVDNSLEFIDKISDIKTAHSIKTFDFSTLYTNLPCSSSFIFQQIYNAHNLTKHNAWNIIRWWLSGECKAHLADNQTEKIER